MRAFSREHRRVASLLALACGVLAGALPPASARALTAPDAIARVNALRVQAGIPPVTEDPALSQGCREHAHYMALNDGGDDHNPHGQNASRPGASPAGAAAAATSVLGAGGWEDPNPWWNAPYHLSQIVSPSLATTGYGEDAGWMCLTTISEPRRTLPLRSVVTFPGPDATGVPFEMTAAELDNSGVRRVPGDTVGLPYGTTTGPHIMVFRSGGDREPSSLQAAEVIGPAGPVPIAIADDFFIIPRGPLQPSTTYIVRALVRFEPHTCRIQGLGVSASELQCPASYGSYCQLEPPTWAPAPPGTPICPPGQPEPDPEPTLPEALVFSEWRLTTAAAPEAERAGPNLAVTKVRLGRLTPDRRLTIEVPAPETGRKATLRVVRRDARCRRPSDRGHGRCRPVVERRVVLIAPQTPVRLPAARKGGSWQVKLSVPRTATHRGTVLRRTYRAAR